VPTTSLRNGARTSAAVPPAGAGDAAAERRGDVEADPDVDPGDAAPGRVDVDGSCTAELDNSVTMDDLPGRVPLPGPPPILWAADRGGVESDHGRDRLLAVDRT
jgi:hypothetical protein